MNSTNSSSTPNPDAGGGNSGGGGGLFATDSIGSIGYGVGVSVGMLILITTFTIATYFCARSNSSSVQQQQQSATDDPEDGQAAAAAAIGGVGRGDLEAGLDEATLKMVYSQAKLRKEMIKEMATSCSICLADYKDTDMLRVLPECGHQFHRRCVDPWLRRHPTCPLCRTSPLPSPIQTPLAEVVPLARRS